MPTEEYATVVGPHERDGRQVWALCCPHTSVNTDDVEARFTPDAARGLFELVRRLRPEFNAEDASWIVLREFLGACLLDRCPGTCATRPYALLHRPDGCRVLDLDDLP